MMLYEMKCYLIVILFLLMITVSVKGDTADYQQKINNIIEKSRKAKTEKGVLDAERELTEYLGTLNSKELLIAGRQYAEWAEKNTPAESWESLEGPMGNLYGILYFYFEVAGDMGLIPVMHAIQNKKENARWRQTLVWATGLSENMSQAKQWELLKTFDTILRDEKDNSNVRAEACGRIVETLRGMHWNILYDDIEVQKFRRENPKVDVYEHLGKEINLSPDTAKRLETVQEAAKKNIQYLLTISAEGRLPQPLKAGIIDALIVYQKTPLSKGKEEEINSTLEDLRNSGEKSLKKE